MLAAHSFNVDTLFFVQRVPLIEEHKGIGLCYSTSKRPLSKDTSLRWRRGVSRCWARQAAWQYQSASALLDGVKEARFSATQGADSVDNQDKHIYRSHMSRVLLVS